MVGQEKGEKKRREGREGEKGKRTANAAVPDVLVPERDEGDEAEGEAVACAYQSSALNQPVFGERERKERGKGGHGTHALWLRTRRRCYTSDRCALESLLA